MLERLLLVSTLLVLGALAYCAFRRYHVRSVAVKAAADPLLLGLRPDVPAIVYFTTPGCVPCKTQQAPALDRLQAHLGEAIQIVRVDASEDSDAAARWGVFSAPTTFVIDPRQQVRQVNHGVADTHTLLRQLEQAR